MGAVQDRGHHLQIAYYFSGPSRRDFLRLLPLRLEEQRGIIQNPFADRGRSLPPGGIQLPGFARVAVMLGEDRRHPLAVLQALPRYRNQKFHRHLRRDLALPHLLLDALRQKLHQRQPPPNPAHAAIEPLRQLFQAVAETLLQFGQQPAHLQHGLMLGKTQRTLQQHGRGFAHRPNYRLHRVSPQLLQNRDPLIAINDDIAVRLAFRRHHYDGRLLPRCGQRR
jgi:hypothetical protein